VTEFPQSGHLKHIHVSVDTCSAAIWATAATSTNAKATQRHWVQAFAVLGVPEQIKTDNGTVYRSQVVACFLQRWGVKHVRGMPYNSTGQAIVERSHHLLKDHLNILKKGEQSPIDCLHKTLFVLNWLNARGGYSDPPAVRHRGTNKNVYDNDVVLVTVFHTDKVVWKVQYDYSLGGGDMLLFLQIMDRWSGCRQNGSNHLE